MVTPASVVLELGCGISGIIGLVLAPRVRRYVLTDQVYVARFVEQNISENRRGTRTDRKPAKGRKVKEGGPSEGSGQLHFAALDWELDEVLPSLAGSGAAGSFDLVVACDCVYNEALIDPLVSTCADACRLRELERGERKPEALHLRCGPATAGLGDIRAVA